MVLDQFVIFLFREGTFYLGGGEGLGNFGIFSKKSVGPPLVLLNSLPPLGN